MPKLYITEFSTLAKDWKGAPSPYPQMPPSQEQNIEITEASVQSAPFAKTTTHVLLTAEIDCSVAWGDNPRAVKEHGLLAAGVDRIVGVTSGQMLAVIANTEE